MIRLRARTVRLAAAPVVLADRAAPEVTGRGQLVVQPGPLLLQVAERRIGHAHPPVWLFYQQPDYAATSTNSKHLLSCRTPPLLRPSADQASGVLSDQQRGAGRHRMGSRQRRLQGHRELLVLDQSPTQHAGLPSSTPRTPSPPDPSSRRCSRASSFRVCRFPGPPRSRRHNGVQAHRVRTTPLARRQRTPPRRSRPRRSQIRERQARRTTRRIRR